MPSIKVKSIEFGQPGFRKLSDIKIEFSDRITVIAGHNGIGKSTIMALVANSSGISSSETHKTLFGRAFQANIFDISYIDYKTEYQDKKDAGVALPEPKITYTINEIETAQKLASLTGRTASKKVRVVPRNVGLQDWSSTDNTVQIKRDAKVELPTIYLGMIRMFPVGEATPSWVKPQADNSLAKQERDFISKFINDVIVGGNAKPTSITSIGIKGTRKTAKHPEYPYDSRSISLGQDSLGSIATALASFQSLKRNHQKYIGGLLVIDEIDAGLHPHAQEKLVAALKKHARQLQLQIIATTHSNHVVESVHPEGKGNAKAPDSVVYITDTKAPRVAADYSLRNILDDMSLKAPSAEKKRTIKLYFEDDEAALFFNRIVPAHELARISNALNIKIKPIPLGIGGTNLAKLHQHDEHFRKVVAIVDADTAIPASGDGITLKLPSAQTESGAGLSPERTILQFATSLANAPKSHASTFVELSKLKVSSDAITEHLVGTATIQKDREAMKSWWNTVSKLIKQWRLIELWAAEHSADVQKFLVQLEAAVEEARKRA